MKDNSAFPLGLIEGFYGRQWSWHERRSIAPFLSEFGYQSYIYAPKGDPWLRSGWREPATEAHLVELQNHKAACHQAGLQWGLGFSPLGFDKESDDQLKLLAKLAEIDSLAPDVLWLLFDDMRGDDPLLAAKQLELIHLICSNSSAKSFAFCPTYYSFDPLLEEVFGAMPKSYWHDLGQGLPDEVAVLWTGDKVISPDYNSAGLQRITKLIGRKPLLWDNYPVNDGRITSNFLHLNAFDRPAEIAEFSAGLFANPANQHFLSRLPLSTLQASLAEASDRDMLRKQSFKLFSDMTNLLERDWPLFQQVGRVELEERNVIETLIAEYRECENPAAKEVVAWLRGNYKFDPACLTD